MTSELLNIKWGRRFAYIVCLSTVLWFVVGFFYVKIIPAHISQIVPVFSTFYGFCLGVVFSLISLIISLKNNTDCLLSFVTSAVIGWISSIICTVPFLFLGNLAISAALTFTLVAGPFSGIFFSLISRLVYRAIAKKLISPSAHQ